MSEKEDIPEDNERTESSNTIICDGKVMMESYSTPSKMLSVFCFTSTEPTYLHPCLDTHIKINTKLIARIMVT